MVSRLLYFVAISSIVALFIVECTSEHKQINKSISVSKSEQQHKTNRFPTAAGSGRATTYYYTKKMVAEATKWTGAVIKYTLDHYNKW